MSYVQFLCCWSYRKQKLIQTGSEMGGGVKFVSLDQTEKNFWDKNKSLSRKITEYDIPLNTCLPYTLPLAF